MLDPGVKGARGPGPRIAPAPPQVMLPLYRILSTLAAQSKVISRGSVGTVVNTLTATLRNHPQPALNTMTAFALLHQGQMSRIIDQILKVMLQFKSAIKLQLTILEFLSMLGRLPTYASKIKPAGFRQVRRCLGGCSSAEGLNSRRSLIPRSLLFSPHLDLHHYT